VASGARYEAGSGRVRTIISGCCGEASLRQVLEKSHLEKRWEDIRSGVSKMKNGTHGESYDLEEGPLPNREA